MNKLYIITGPAGVGKSTISNEIAKNLKKSVLIEGDTIYNFFVAGRIKPWLENAPLDLFWNNCIYLINSYLTNGYDIVFNYIINPNYFNSLKNIFKDYEIIFKVLMTDEQTIIKRDKERPIDCQMGERSLVLLKEFINYNFDDKYILDTSKLTINETISKIMEG
jgi:cytidylate kinase